MNSLENPLFPAPSKIQVKKNNPYPEQYPMRPDDVYCECPEGIDMTNYPYYYVGEVMSPDVVKIDNVSLSWDLKKNKVRRFEGNNWVDKETAPRFILSVAESDDDSGEVVGFVCKESELVHYAIKQGEHVVNMEFDDDLDFDSINLVSREEKINRIIREDGGNPNESFKSIDDFLDQ